MLSRGLFTNSDIIVAVGVIGIVIMMVVPMPPVLLDMLLALNLTLALVILLVTLYTTEPLQFSVFPSLLLVTTLFRLALNVSSTRLILLYGYAGEIIRRFGEFVVGGNPIVGFVIFCILVVIQFVVITRGAERVAEVAARFTLDAMPGKQMAIDADLNSGLIDEAGARQRRREVEREADFYGAMDGASKFVKGDAIAGIVITLINLIGGFIIGVAQRGLPLTEALQRYSLLTVGDGLVTQVPALLISTATGIVVTRAASEMDMGHDIISQLFHKPRVLYVAAGMLALLAVVPGLPSLPFLALAGCAFSLAYALNQGQKRPEPVEVDARRQELDRLRQPESIMSMMQVDPLEIELGYGLIPLVGSDGQGELMGRIVLIRRQIALDVGFVLPPVRVRDNMTLAPNAYVIKLKGVAVGRGELFLDRYLAMGPMADEREIEGIPTREPAFGLPAVWIGASSRDKAERLGYTVVDAPSVLATHLVEVIRAHTHELLSRQEVRKLVDAVREHSPAVVEELIPEVMTIGELQKILQNLLREGVPIRDLVTILEAAADCGRSVRDPDLVTEYVRQALFRTITARFASADGRIKALLLSPVVEDLILRSVQQTDRQTLIAIDPQRLDRLLKGIRTAVERVMAQGLDPVILCAAAVRPYLRRIVERVSPRIAVLSFNELDPAVKIESQGVLSEHED